MTSLDELPELAPYLPDMDDLEDELAEAVGRPVEDPARVTGLSGGTTDEDGLVRLQKLLAQSGVALAAASARS